MVTNTARSAARMLTALTMALCMLLAFLPVTANAASGERHVKKAKNGIWVCVKDGKIDKDYIGIAGNKYGWWRVYKGKVSFKANGLFKNEYGMWYVKNGKVDFDYDGIVENKKGWWRVRDGKVDLEANGVFQNKHGWWYVKQGKVDFDYDGLASNSLGNWYVKNGKVDFKKNGTYSKGGVDYTIEGGKVKGNGKIIYLTFDDGPGPYTDQLLRTLDKYGVKATFFVTNVDSSYQYDINKEYQAGHAVAVHTHNHSYGNIYRSTSNFWADHYKMQGVIEKQTGRRVTMFRFPGGSSNTVSRRYSRGVMSSLVKQAGEKGLTYYDWNVDSDDAGKTRSSDGVFRNITGGVRYYKHSIVLCHDVKPYTVNAMDRTIKWCLENGYTFCALQPDGYTYHMKVAN